MSDPEFVRHFWDSLEADIQRFGYNAEDHYYHDVPTVLPSGETRFSGIDREELRAMGIIS